MNAYAARALLSRIYLYHDDNEKAFQMASNLIEEVEGNGMYRLIHVTNMFRHGI